MKSWMKIAIIAIILFLALLLIVRMIIKSANVEITEAHKFYQYFFGRKIEYDGKLHLSRENEITKLTFDGALIELDATPIYYADVKDKLLLPEDMAIVYLNDLGKMKKVNRFSNVQILDGVAYVEKNKKNREVEKIFLYDGRDIYLFIEKTTLKIGEEEYELSPLSYVNCGVREVDIYQKSEDKYTTIELNGETVLVENKSYTINLSTDILREDNVDQLLIKNIDFLEHF